MKVLETLFGRRQSSKPAAEPVARPTLLDQQQLKLVAGGLPRVGPCSVTPVAAQSLPSVS